MLPEVMGVVNATPDSFYEGSRVGGKSLDAAFQRCAQLVEQGANWLDIGGESTRPGAAAVSSQQECDRVVPLLEKVMANLNVKVSVDTSNPDLMRDSVAIGVDMINDVRALQRPGAVQAVAAADVYICLMHMQGNPETMQQQPAYSDVVSDVTHFLKQRVAVCQQAGIDNKRIYLDPGFGFGKTTQHNFQLLNQLERLTDLEWPVLIGLSRKSMIGIATGKAANQRLVGSVTGALLASQKGARIIRVHDVAETIDALNVWQAMITGGRHLD